MINLIQFARTRSLTKGRGSYSNKFNLTQRTVSLAQTRYEGKGREPREGRRTQSNSNTELCI
jgi:hypothetical protein